MGLYDPLKLMSHSIYQMLYVFYFTHNTRIALIPEWTENLFFHSSSFCGGAIRKKKSFNFVKSNFIIYTRGRSRREHPKSFRIKGPAEIST